MITESVALKRVAAVNMGQSPPSELYNDMGLGLPFLQGNAEFGVSHPTPRLWCPDPAKACEPGDILLSVRAPVGAKNLADQVYGIGRGLCAITPRTVHPRFLWYAVDVFIGELRATAQGSTYAAVTADDVARVSVPVPATDRQAVIAQFLDREIARIDGLIRRRRDLVRLLALRRSALLANALVGRSGASAQVLPTGEPALPQLPRGWRPVRLRHVTTELTVGVVVTPAAFYAEEGLPFIRGYNVRPGQVTDHDLALISPAGNTLHSKSILRSGDVLVVRTGQAGAAAVVPDWAVGGNCVDVLIVRCSSLILPKFLELVLNSEHMARQVETITVGAIQSHFNVNALQSVVVPLPPLDEQERLISAVAGEDAPMLRLMEAGDRQVQLLMERRQALISAAVTGQALVLETA